MYITDILNNLPKQDSNSLSTKIYKNAEVRKIKQRLENFTSSILDFLGDENAYINRGLTYCSSPSEYKLSEQDKKELTNLLVSEVKSFPDKLKAEINKFFEDIETSSNKEDDKEDDKEENGAANITVAAIKANEPIEGSSFGY